MSFVSNLPLVSVKLCISSSPVLLTVFTAGPRKKSTKSDRTLRHSNFVPSGNSISVSHWSPANDKIGFVAWGILAVCLKTKTYMFEFELKGGLTYWEKIYFIFQETHVKLLFLKTDNESMTHLRGKNSPIPNSTISRISWSKVLAKTRLCGRFLLWLPKAMSEASDFFEKNSRDVQSSKGRTIFFFLYMVLFGSWK